MARRHPDPTNTATGAHPAEERPGTATPGGAYGEVRAAAHADDRPAVHPGTPAPGDPLAPGTAPAPGDTLTTPAAPATGDTLAAYLRAQATEFLRALRLHRETGAGAAAPAGDALDAARALRRSARRISGSLHTFRPLLDADWSEQIRPELAWLSGTLALEHACEARLERLLLALHRLSGAPLLPGQPTTSTRKPAPPAPAATTTPTTSTPRTPTAGTLDTPPERGTLTVGAAKAGALLDRQLTLARTRAHSTALQALGSSRFHAVADKIALLASEVPLAPQAQVTPLKPLAGAAEERLTAAISTLPLLTAGSPYNAEALIHGLSPDTAPHPQDAPWHQVRLLLRLHRYALEALGEPLPDVRLQQAGEALDRHRDASEAAAAAAHAARTPRIAPATAYALGVLHADQRHEVEAARYAFQQSWQTRTLTPSP
ncbi:CHAD domain-containing protein [Streptomyces roseirectus]|uniref:CHAD domain-containing protein n=1 Tax=Streptomyces roseirectus TaxID=2768066 RepID=A0A7H0IGD6_9ACTN|nr:CHAD domain-containing protein [Streptomyces roseirectus]QNP71852.1 CHAD domain-containing protein [Streptomyces roseirectus]